MKIRQPLIAAGLLLVLGIAIVGLLQIDRLQQAAFSAGQTGYGDRVVVDEEPVLTARALAHFAATPDERVNAEEALQSADEEVETAFASALRNAKERPVLLSPEAAVAAARVEKVEHVVGANQARVNALTKQLAEARVEQKPSIQDRLQIAQAQLELDQDQAEDAKQDLLRSEGDPARIARQLQRQLDRHKMFEQHGLEASSEEANSSDAGYDASNLVAQATALYTLTQKTTLLRRAIWGAVNLRDRLYQRHSDLKRRVKAVLQAGNPPNGKPVVPVHLAHADSLALSDLTKRMADEEDLETTYSDWVGFVSLRQRVALRGVIRSCLWIILIIPSVFLVGRGVGYFLVKASQTRPHFAHLNAIFQFAVQAAGVLLILIIILGFPQHVPEAIFGLVGAGVTVALKNFSGNYIDNRIHEVMGGSAKGAAAGQ